MRGTTVLVVLPVVLLLFPEVARSASVEDDVALRGRAKRSATSASLQDVLASSHQSSHALVLVPYTRSKRSTQTNHSDHETTNDIFGGDKPKYKRLSHSVHVQSDIRYRLVRIILCL